LKLTVGKWFAPSGLSIDHVGKVPDIVIPFNKENYQKNGFDNQLEKAKTILSQYR
jgi:C-terminal processing protease CtpA/Prc